MRMKLACAAASACAALILMTSANATAVCPFTDNFFIAAPLPLHVISATTEGNLEFTQMGVNYFKLSCQDFRVTTGGNLYIQIGMNDNSKCSLKIQDGPYEMNPSVTEVNCGGTASTIFYIGMDHAFGSHDYTLKFMM